MQYPGAFTLFFHFLCRIHTLFRILESFSREVKTLKYFCIFWEERERESLVSCASIVCWLDCGMGEYFLRTIILLSLIMFHSHKEIFEKYTLLIVVLMIPKKNYTNKIRISTPHVAWLGCWVQQERLSEALLLCNSRECLVVVVRVMT